MLKSKCYVLEMLHDIPYIMWHLIVVLQYGLYSAFMGVFIYALLGTSKDITLGPTAIMSLLVAEFASDRSPVPDDPTYAIVLTLISGLMQLVMGLLNMGEYASQTYLVV